MRLRRSWVAVACLVVLAACSPSEDDGAAGAAGSGGSSGTGGSSGSGGSSGTGGSSGEGGSAGASGSGGGSAGDSGSGGAAGSGGGSAGDSGSGGGTATPRCDDLCSDIVAADCAEGPTEPGCLLTCKALTSSSACDDVANDYFDCTDAATFECSTKGEPVAPGCGVKYLVAIDCAVTENPNPTMVGPCGTYCDNVVGQNCTSGGTEEDCNKNCLWLGATGTGCDDEWSTYLGCANAATWACALGYAVPIGCGADWQAYKACIDAAGGT